MEQKLYTVVMGDLMGSRGLDAKGRHQAQLFLKSTLVQINENCKGATEAPFMISKGDEFQGVLKEPVNAMEIIYELERLLFPLGFRFGMGIGIIHKMGGKLPIEMDGPAFHRASASLITAKKKKKIILIQTGHVLLDNLLNQSFTLIQAIKYRWNNNHYSYYWDYKEMQSIKKMAEFRQITSQAVSEQVKKLHIKDIISSEKIINEALKEISKNYDTKKSMEIEKLL